MSDLIPGSELLTSQSIRIGKRGIRELMEDIHLRIHRGWESGLSLDIPLPRHPDGSLPSPEAAAHIQDVFQSLQTAASHRIKNQFENRNTPIQNIGLALDRNQPIQAGVIEEPFRDPTGAAESRQLLGGILFPDSHLQNIYRLRPQYLISPDAMTEYINGQWMLNTRLPDLRLLITDYLENTSAGMLSKAAADISGRILAGMKNDMELPPYHEPKPGKEIRKVTSHLIYTVPKESVFADKPDLSLTRIPESQFRHELSRGRDIPIFPLDQIP